MNTAVVLNQLACHNPRGIWREARWLISFPPLGPGPCSASPGDTLTLVPRAHCSKQNSVKAPSLHSSHSAHTQIPLLVSGDICFLVTTPLHDFELQFSMNTFGNTWGHLKFYSSEIVSKEKGFCKDVRRAAAFRVRGCRELWGGTTRGVSSLLVYKGSHLLTPGRPGLLGYSLFCINTLISGPHCDQENSPIQTFPALPAFFVL